MRSKKRNMRSVHFRRALSYRPIIIRRRSYRPRYIRNYYSRYSPIPMTETEAKVWLGILGITVTAALVAGIVSSSKKYIYDYPENIVKIGSSTEHTSFSILRKNDDHNYEESVYFIKTPNAVTFMGRTCHSAMKYQKSSGTPGYYKFCCIDNTKSMFYIKNDNLQEFLNFLKA